MIFDPAKLRKNGFSEGMLNYLLSTEYDAARPMGNVARSELNVILSAWLVGLHEEVAPALQRCCDWLTRAIGEDEEFGASQDLHRKNLNVARAIAEWMIAGAESASWEHALKYEELAWQYAKRPWPDKEIISDGLDDYLAFAYLAGNYGNPEAWEKGIRMYERWLGDKPPSLAKAPKPRELGYALCLHRVTQMYQPDDLLIAGRKMLRANLEHKWFGAGQYIRGAMWLKIVYGNRDQFLFPRDVILRAYDDMPHVEKPGFLVR